MLPDSSILWDQRWRIVGNSYHCWLHWPNNGPTLYAKVLIFCFNRFNVTPKIYLGKRGQLWRNISLSVCCLVSQPTNLGKSEINGLLKYCCWLDLGPTTSTNGGFWLPRPMMVQHILVDRIELSSQHKSYIIMHKLYNFFFYEKLCDFLLQE